MFTIILILCAFGHLATLDILVTLAIIPVGLILILFSRAASTVINIIYTDRASQLPLLVLILPSWLYFMFRRTRLLTTMGKRWSCVVLVWEGG